MHPNQLPSSGFTFSESWGLARHREDGPAIEYPNGTKNWCLNGMFHREDGPAIIDADGTEEWFLYGEEVSEEEFNQWLEKKRLNEKLHATLAPRQKEKKKKI